MNTIEEKKSYTGWIIGMMIAWLIPLIGFPVIIYGMTQAWKQKDKVFMIWSIIAFFLVTSNAAIGGYVGWNS
jgi:hypothetical protein